MEAVKQDIEDYVLLAHAGHGVNSYAIHVFVVHGPLALFLQVPWGGVYMDPKKSARRLADVFDCAGQLITAVREADTTDRLEPGKAAVRHGESGRLDVEMVRSPGYRQRSRELTARSARLRE